MLHNFLLLQMLFLDETGWSCLSKEISGVKCLALAKYREEVYRYASKQREHITMLPPVAVLLDDEGEIESIHHMSPLFVFPRKYVNTKFAESTLDPANKLPTNLMEKHDLVRRGFIKESPHGIPAPTPFERYVAASTTGNVNSVMVYNFFVKCIIPWLRGLGVSIDDRTIVNWDKHASHTSQELLSRMEQENMPSAFFPGHATNWLQLQDLEQFMRMKGHSGKDIDAWTVFLHRHDQSLALHDFPFVVHHAYTESIKESVTRRGLKKAGLFPFNPDAVLKKMPGGRSLAECKQIIAAQDIRRSPRLAQKQALVSSSSSSSSSLSKPPAAPGGTLRRSPRLAEKWNRTFSEPFSNRSKGTPFPRLKQDPFSMVWSTRVDIDDFAGQKRQRKMMGLVRQRGLRLSAASRSRGKRVGKEGDVFSAKEVQEARDRAVKEKAEKKRYEAGVKARRTARQQRNKQGLENLRRENEKLRRENKKLKKALEVKRQRASVQGKKRPRPRGHGRSRRKKPKVDYSETKSEEEESEEEESEEEESEEEESEEEESEEDGKDKA